MRKLLITAASAALWFAFIFCGAAFAQGFPGRPVPYYLDNLAYAQLAKKFFEKEREAVKRLGLKM